MKEQKYPYDVANTSVSVAERWVASNRSLGARCPCCGQLAKVYRRKLYSSMAAALIRIYRESKGGEAVHVPTVLDGSGAMSHGGDFAKLVYWGLLEPATEGAGFYSVTAAGRDFVECRIVVPEAVLLYDGECVGVDDTRVVSVVDALGTKFNYEQLMGES